MLMFCFNGVVTKLHHCHPIYTNNAFTFHFTRCRVTLDYLWYNLVIGLVSFRLHLGVHKGREGNGIEYNDHKGMEMNEMYLSKRNEWKRMESNGIK